MTKNISDSKDIHGYNYVVNLYLEKIKANKKILPANKKHLLDYFADMEGWAAGTKAKNLQVCHTFALLWPEKDFKGLTQEEMQDWARTIKARANLAQWSKVKYLVCIKKFFRWLYKLPKGQYPAVVQLIEVKAPGKTKLPEAILLPEDIKAIIQACTNNRDKFFVSAFYDLGNRASELGTMDLKDIEDNPQENFLLFKLMESKTQPRALPVRNCRPYLLKYLAEIPRKEKDAPLLQYDNGSRMNYPEARKMYQKAFKRTGINKPMDLHHLRRSAATLYGQFFNESELDAWFGWGKQKTSNIYVSLSGKNLLAAYDKFWNSEKNVLRQTTCKKCNTINEGVLEYCQKCRNPLLEKTVLSAEQESDIIGNDILNELSRSPEFVKLLTKMVLQNKKTKQWTEALQE